MSKKSSFYTFLATLLAFAAFSACSSDSSSSGPDSSESSMVKDTVYVRDTVYVPIDTSASISSESAIAASSASEQTSSMNSSDATPVNTPESSDATPASSSETVPASSTSVPASSTDDDTPASNATANSANSAADENLLWSDEFDGEAIDETKWGYNIGTGDNGWGNGEWEYYTDRAENVYVKDGLLHIRASLETNADDIANKFGGQKYTSARIITQNKFTFAYGTVEARIALPAGKGIWPAFWMLGENIDKVSWPACGEIDIIEAINDENVIYGTHHWAHEGTHAQYGNSTKQHFDGHYDLDITEFHVYKMTWDKNAISMYVDDFMYQKIDIADAAGEMGTFHKPFFFILNVAVGGSWPGFDIDDAQFPTEMQVDYIRVYKEAP
ncbi:MAG: glycoside hydrolase family 16 protein [Fibrobacter sp.]|nr:glycoside hydrolase family 16 protein [Fibrobacter sp.]